MNLKKPSVTQMMQRLHEDGAVKYKAYQPIKLTKKGEKIGILNVYISGELEKQIDVFSAEDIKRSNIFSRLFKSLNYLVWGDA